MKRRAMLACVALILGACSESKTQAQLTRLAEHQGQFEQLEAQLLEFSESVDLRRVEVNNSFRTLEAEYRGEHNKIAEQLAALQAEVAELRALQDAQGALVNGLKEEVERLAVQLNTIQTAQSRPVQRRAQTPGPAQTPKPIAPTFDVTGIELRGGRPFVAVASHDAQALNDIRLLELGESFAGWRVSRVGDRSVEFTSGSGVFKLAVQ